MSHIEWWESQRIMHRKLLVGAFILLLAIAAVPAGAQTGIVWNGEFYNNALLQGPPAFTRQDSAIAFDWGSGSSGTGVNADNFSIRWGTDPFFAAGTYRFWALADDKVRVYVDFAFTPLIDTFNTAAVGQVVSGDITLTQGVHHIQVDYQEAGGNAFVYVTWANLATNPTGPNFPLPVNWNPVPVSGPWTAQYYANASLTGSPTLIQTESSPSHDWGTGSPVASIPADNFSARWTSVLTLEAGTYQVTIRADDGVKVTIDGVAYINEWHGATGNTYTTVVNLSAGQHSFLIEFYEASGVAFLNYTFARAGNVVPTPVPGGASMTVTGAFRLNVRDQPSATFGVIRTRISRNETYPIVGRNPESTWWQINANGIIGWVNARFVTAVNTANVPITSGTIVPPTGTPATCATAPAPRLVVGRLGRVTPGVPNNLRAQPSSTGALLGQIPANALFSVVGGPQCANGYYWWQVNYNGLVGWTAEGSSREYWIEPAS